MIWNDPTERARLIDRVGPQEYERLFAEHRKASTMKTVNGHAIRPVQSRFGRLFAVGNTGKAFATMPQAEAFAASVEAK
jgi:hypothetical protein